MAKFKLSVEIKNNENIINSIFCDFDSALENNNSQWNFSYDEQLKLNENSQNELTFKMTKHINEYSKMVLNPFSSIIAIGSLINLIDKNNKKYKFIVNSIDYEIYNENVILNYKCQDYFSYSLSRRNSNYFIENDSSKTNFIGAQYLDYWANKIHDESFISDYKYLDLNYKVWKGKKIDNVDKIWNTGNYIIKPNVNLNAIKEWIENCEQGVAINDRKILLNNKGTLEKTENEAWSFSNPPTNETPWRIFWTLDSPITFQHKGSFSEQVKKINIRYVYNGMEHSIDLNPLNFKEDSQLEDIWYYDVSTFSITETSGVQLTYILSEEDNWIETFYVNDDHSNWTSFPPNNTIIYSSEGNSRTIEGRLVVIPQNFSLFLNKTCYSLYDNSWYDSIQEEIKTSYDQSYDNLISFSCSDSNIYNALITLGDKYGMLLDVNDDIDAYWFIPNKNSTFKGYYYSPNLDLIGLNLSQAADSLCTILNVESTENNNNELITLIPELPASIINWFGSNDWTLTEYFSGMYKNHYTTKNISINRNMQNPQDPLDEEKVQDEGNNYYSCVFLKTQLGINSSKIIENVQLKVRYLTESDSNVTSITCDVEKNGEWIPINNDNIDLSLWNNNDENISFRFFNGYSSIDGDPITFDFNINQKITDADKELYTNLDSVPYLENKIINFDYFYDNGIIDLNDYQNLTNLIYNDLRIINGQLIYWQNIYYEHLKSTNGYLNSIQNQLDLIGADIQQGLTTVYKEGNNLTRSGLDTALNNTDFTNDYNTLTSYNIKVNNSNLFVKTAIVDYYAHLTSYGKYAENAVQCFLKGCYEFKEYYNSLCNFNVANETYTNGQYYWMHKDEENNNTIIQNVGLIEMNLTSYWEQAYTASLYCQYFLPEAWNGELNKYTCFPVCEDEEEDYILKSEYFPTDVQKGYRPKINWICAATIPDNYLIPDNIETIYGYNCFYQYPQISNDEYKNNWFGQVLSEDIEFKTDYEIYYYIPTNGSYGKLWTEMTDNDGLLEKTYISGQYVQFYKILRDGYKEKNISQYTLIQEQQKQKWRDIYKQYHNVLLENTFTNSEATSSKELLDSAILCFRDLSKPEPQYNVSILDYYNLNQFLGLDANGEPIFKKFITNQLKVTDQIAFASQDFYYDYDELKKLLEQKVFITNIEYNLRSDNDIKLTVNPIKYKDKLINKLVSLIQ